MSLNLDIFVKFIEVYVLIFFSNLINLGIHLNRSGICIYEISTMF